MTEADVLTAIDDALEMGAVTEDETIARELQELALLLQADAPGPAPEFRESLGRRVDEGFAKAARARRRVSVRRFMNPAIATGLIMLPLVLIAIVAGGGGSSGDDSGGGAQGGGGGAVSSSGGGGDSAAPAVVEAQPAPGRGAKADQTLSARSLLVPPAGRGFAPGRSDRKIERSFEMELETPVDDMQRVADEVTTVTNRHGGFVLSSSVSTGEDGAGGDFNLRIPASEVRAALRDLAALADVRSQSQSGRDITPEYVTAADRLRAARAERKSLLRRLEAATTDTEAEAIRRRLDIVAGEINGLRGRMHGLRLRTNYAVVTVTLAAKDGSGGAGGGSFDDAMGDAGDILVGIAGVLVRVLAVALPLGLIALIGWLAGRAVRRRRRESALA